MAEEFGSFGIGSCIGFPPATLLNTRSIHLGSGVLVRRQATLSVGYGVGDPSLPERGLVIGDRCILGARTSITAHASVVPGESVFCGQGVFIIDASHGSQDPDRPIDEQFGARHLEPGVGWVSGSGRGDVRSVLTGIFGEGPEAHSPLGGHSLANQEAR